MKWHVFDFHISLWNIVCDRYILKICYAIYIFIFIFENLWIWIWIWFFIHIWTFIFIIPLSITLKLVYLKKQQNIYKKNYYESSESGSSLESEDDSPPNAYAAVHEAVGMGVPVFFFLFLLLALAADVRALNTLLIFSLVLSSSTVVFSSIKYVTTNNDGDCIPLHIGKEWTFTLKDAWNWT